MCRRIRGGTVLRDVSTARRLASLWAGCTARTRRRAAAAAPRSFARYMRSPTCCQQMHAACCMQSIPHAHAQVTVTDARTHLPMGRVRWQVHVHKCARAPPHVLALHRCARAHCRLKAFRSRGR
eukprot:6213167-Pleurochrysis_carterae.AAC.2